jgi:hypothetical protein
MKISRSILLRMRNIFNRSYREIKHSFYFECVFTESYSIHEITWKIWYRWTGRQMTI